MIFSIKQNRWPVMLLAAVLFLAACNEEPEGFPDITPVTPTGPTLGDRLPENADDSLYYRMVVRAGMLPLISSRQNTFTMFVPNNNAVKVFVNAASGGQVPLNAPDAVFSGFISTALPPATAAAIVSYNTVPQKVPSSALPATFPNLQYPSILNPAPQLSAFLRLTDFVSARNGAYLNNIPIISADRDAANGTIHGIAAVNIPPSQFLWERINSDPDLTLLKAAIQKADSAAPVIQGALQNIGANFTVFAPNNLAFKQLIFALSGGQVPVSAPDAVFIGVIQSNAVPSALAGGLVAYHVFDGRSGRPGRAFLNNFPTTVESYKTLLNSNPAAVNHPGVGVVASFTGPIVSAATVIGLGNATASNVLVNPTPAPNGSSDQHYVNGTLHKIDQVLLPQ